jgi:peptidoglycan/xylan/chitin deacetylase (PgdA/CDA1 family)
MLMAVMVLLCHASGSMVVGLRAIEQLVAANQASALSGDSIRVPILVYHSIAPHHAGQTGEQRELDVDTTTFRAQMNYIARLKHPVVPFSAVVDALEGKGKLPDRAVVITFDDGWLDQYEDAFHILKQYGFTATFFVYTSAIGLGPAFMTWDELREMQRAGMIIGAHSRTHPDLTKAGVSLVDEINGSRDDIQRNLGVTPNLFAYPYGGWDARAAAAVRAAGFRAARAMGDGPVNTPATRFALKSVLATDDMSAFARALGDRVP